MFCIFVLLLDCILLLGCILLLLDCIFVLLFGCTFVLYLCASKMRMEPLLFADENAPEWAFSKRKGVKNPLLKKC